MVGLSLISGHHEASRRTRRVLVAASVIGLAGWLVVASAFEHTGLDPGSRFVFTMFLLGLVSLPLLAIQNFRRNAVRRADPPLDERERQRRDDAYRVAYRVVEWGLVLGFLAWAWLRWNEELLLALDGMLALLVAWAYVAFLPSMVFAWREPDAIE